MKRAFKSWTDLRVLPAPVWSLVIASFVNRLGAMALPFLTLYLVRSARLEVATAAGMLAVYGAVALVAGPVAGRLCDRFGASRVMIGSLAASGIVLCVYPLAHSAGAIALLTACWSLAAETFRPAGLVRLTALVKAENRRQAFALHRLAINLGMSIGPAVAGFLAEISFPSIFVVDGATSLAAAATLAWAHRPDDVNDEPRAPPPKGLPFGALADRKLALALGALFLLAVLFFQGDSSVPLILVRDRHFTPALYGAMFSVNTVIIVIFEIPLNAAIAKWPHRRVLSVGALFAAAGFGGLVLVRNVAELAVTVVLWTIGEMIYSPGIATYVAEIAPAARRGEYIGLYSMTYSVAFIVAPWCGILTLEHFGMNALGIGMVSTGILSAALFARLDSGPASERAEAAPSSG